MTLRDVKFTSRGMKDFWQADLIVETLADVAPHLDPEAEEANIRRIMLAQGDTFPPMPGAAELLQDLPPERWGLVTSALAQNVRHRFTVAGLPLPPCSSTIAA